MTLKQSVLWNTWGSTFYLGCQWLLTVLIARILGYKDAGVFSLAMSITNIFYSFAIFGMRNFQISDMTDKYSDGTYIVSRCITGVVAFLGCVAFVLMNNYNTKQISCIVVFMVFRLSEAFFDVLMGIYQKKWRMDYMGKSMTVRGVLMLISFITVMVVTKDLLMSIVCMTISVFAVVIFYDVQNSKRLVDISLNFEQKMLLTLLLECMPLVIFSVISTSIGSVPRFFLEKYSGIEKLGIYASIAMPTLIVQMVATYIFNPMITVFAEKFAKHDKKGFIEAINKCVIAILAVSIVSIIGAKIFGNLGLRILYGKGITKYEYLLLPLVMCAVFTAFTWLLSAILTVIRAFRGLVISNLLSLISCVLASIIIIPRYGMQGTTIAYLIGLLIGVLFLCISMRNKMKEEEWLNEETKFSNIGNGLGIQKKENDCEKDNEKISNYSSIQ